MASHLPNIEPIQTFQSTRTRTRTGSSHIYL